MHERQWVLATPFGLLGFAAFAIAVAVAWSRTSAEPWVFGLLAPVLVLLLSGNLSVRVEGDAVRLSYWPFWRRRIALAEVASAQPVTYRPIVRFGGWGIRFGAGAVAYTVRGREGVLLRLRSGKCVLLGSQRPLELAQALKARGVPVEAPGNW